YPQYDPRLSLPEACHVLFHRPSPAQAGPSDLSRAVGHMGMRVDETRNHDTTMEIDATRPPARPSFHLGLGPDGDEAIVEDRHAMCPRPNARGGEASRADEREVRLAGDG